MDQIALIILFVLGIPLAVGIWLIVRAISARDRLEELTRRVDHLQLELLRLRRSDAVPTKTTEEKISGFMPATAPPQTAGETVVPAVGTSMREDPERAFIEPQIPPPVATQPAGPVPPPIELPGAPALFPTAMTSQPAAGPGAPEMRPPMVPPPIIPRFVPSAVLRSETVLENAQAAAVPSPAPLPAAPKDSFEMRVGKFWAVRVGVVVILTSLVFGANLAYHNIVPRLGPVGKVSLLYLASALLLGAGAWWQRRNVKESLSNYAQVLFAGGLAAVYFTTYAAHYAPPVCVIDSPLRDGTLLLAWAGVIAWIADRRKSEIMALFAIGLAFFTSVITRVGEFTLYSNLILTIAAVVFLVRNRWAALSFASLITSYAGYAFWRFLHPDGWHWATPEENLGLGAGFLAGYWVVFTAATFLSKSDKLSGPNRAAFLTLNNGAYFALFLLTMLQVHTGGFWKFSLIYGSALLALALAAGRFLASEPLTKNSYLTHGLVLVTLGFISKFAGLQLALVLGAESIVLYVLGTQRQSPVLKFFAHAAALLAIGWCAAGLKEFDAQDLWMATGVGAMLAFNAVWAHRRESQAAAEPRRLESSAFTLLSFASWVLAAWFNTREPHLLVALVLGVEGAVFYNLLGGYKTAVPKVAAYASAVGAASWCLAGLSQFDTMGLWIAIGVGAIMVANALRAHRADRKSTLPLRPEPSAWAVLAFAPWLAATWFNTSAANLPLVLAAEAVALTFSIYLLRLREITLLGQLFLILAQIAWLFHYATATPPWWNPLLVIAATLGLSHWWQHQKTIAISRNFFACYSTMFALAAVGVALVWLHPLVSAPSWLVLTSLLAVAVTAYGLLTRAWMLAICGQVFLAVSTWEFLQQLTHEKPEWYFPLAPLAGLAGLSWATLAWFARQPESKPEIRQPLLQVALIYRWLALVMSLGWIWDYVPERERVWTCMLAAAAVFALPIWRSSREALVAVAVYAVAALTLLWARDNLVMDIYWPNLLALLALFVMQQSLRRRSAKLPLDENVHGTLVIVAGLSLWRYLSCWTAPYTSGFYVTMTWAGFAVIAFTAGILLHERFLRWFGLGVLASTIGRVVLVDVWRQETLGRVLTFLALGLALSAVGFIYNKFEDKIRQWL